MHGFHRLCRVALDKLGTGESVDGYMSFFKAQQIAESRGFINQMREEANTARNLVGQLNALIAEMEALEDQGEVFDTLMDLRDDREAARTKLQGLNELITEADNAFAHLVWLWFFNLSIEYKIGNGEWISVRHDKWYGIGRLSQFVTNRDIYDARFNNKPSLVEMIDNDKWKWHNERKDVFPVLISIHNILSHAFVLWMAIQKRLMTQDRIYQWNKDNSMKCSLCSSCMDSHDHLFFQCSFSSAIWVIVKGKSYIDNLKSNWDDSVSSMALFNKKAIKDIVRRLVFGALIRESNSRLRVEKSRPEAFETMAELSSLHIGVFLFERYGSILNILQGRNELLEKNIGCVVDSGGVPELDPKVSDIWGLFRIA
ncbi:retrovirus-related pol polyprotein from transposon TNT 1-94 [Tanacetum coccineum]